MKDLVGRHLTEWRKTVVLPYVEGRLLDIGCGLNELVAGYEGKGTGVDVYQWGKVDLVVEDSSSLPFENETYDTVAIIASLNHIPNRSMVLSEAYRLLKPGGKIVLTMIPPGIAWVWHLLRKPWDADQKERKMKQGEVYGLRRAEVRRLLTEAGFTIVIEESFMLGINRLTIATKNL